MPQAKVLSTVNPSELRCPVNYKTLEMTSSCDQYSISKIVQKTKSKSNKGELIINTELITEAIKAATKKHLINKIGSSEKIMSPVEEKSERDSIDLSPKNIVEAEEAKVGDNSQEGSDITDNNPETETNFELEPVRFDLYTVRRRSRQFYPVNEEASERGMDDNSQYKVPVFNLGRSLKNLYCKDTESQQQEDQTDEGEEKTPSHPVEYDSDSGLLRKVRVYKPLRKIHSLPEMSKFSLEDERTNFGFEPLGHSTSNSGQITNIPHWNPQNQQMQKSPGYAFLASVADNLRGKQSKAVSMHVDKSVAKEERKPGPLTESKVVPSQNYKVETSTPRPSSAPVIDSYDAKSKKSFLTSVYEWGTQAKSQISQKEINMYSPISF